MRNELHAEFFAHAADVANAWATVESLTGPADRELARFGFHTLYDDAGWNRPSSIVWHDSPTAAIAAIREDRPAPALFTPNVGTFQRLGEPGRLSRDVFAQLERLFDRRSSDRSRALVSRSVPTGVAARALASRAGLGQHDGRWIGVFDALDGVAPIECRAMLGVRSLARSCGWWWAYRGIAHACERQSHVARDANGRYHATDGPAVAFRDGTRAFAIHGVGVEPWIVASPEKITTALIAGETSAEVRRVMIERFGPARYLTAIDATAVHVDRYGTLYAVDGSSRAEPIAMVRVTNATAEPDGTYREYFLRVPPTMRSAHEAVAWTFGLTPRTYRPLEET